MKRRGFTLIELMVVIAIIIILAAIAIPNYLSMTARAKRSRVASDFAALATALETFRTDWNVYPVSIVAAVNLPASPIYKELTGKGATSSNKNYGTTAAGETAPIEYMAPNILTAMTNPYISGDSYFYTSAAGVGWVLTCATTTGGTASSTILSRTDLTTTLTGPSTALTEGK